MPQQVRKEGKQHENKIQIKLFLESDLEYHTGACFPGTFALARGQRVWRKSGGIISLPQYPGDVRRIGIVGNRERLDEM